MFGEGPSCRMRRPKVEANAYAAGNVLAVPLWLGMQPPALTKLLYIPDLTRLSNPRSIQMSITTVGEFALRLRKSPEALLEQLRDAGVDKSSANDRLWETDKQKLLGYLQASHGTASGERKKITLVKKPATEVKQLDEASPPGRTPVHNRIIIVGNIGRDELTESWQRRYDAALASMADWLCRPRATCSFEEAARNLKAVFEALRGKLRLTLRPSWERIPAAALRRAQLVTAGQHSFFYAGKVDGRNAP